LRLILLDLIAASPGVEGMAAVVNRLDAVHRRFSIVDSFVNPNDPQQPTFEISGRGEEMADAIFSADHQEQAPAESPDA
jgi:hypothetical protein